MASPHSSPKDHTQVVAEGSKGLDNSQRSLDRLRCLSPEEKTETGMLLSRLAEQSSLICILQQRSEEMLLRCQALQEANVELKGLVAAGQQELDSERRKSAMLEKRFLDLASNHREIIGFKDEYKRGNAKLRLENERLRTENEALFSQKLQDKGTLVEQLKQEIQLMAEKHKSMEDEHREKEDGLRSKLLEQTGLGQSKEASLLSKLHDAQRQLRDARQKLRDADVTGDDLKRQMQKATLERDKFLTISTERGKEIEEKQEQIQHLGAALKEVEKAKAKAEERFERDASAVNANLKVQSLLSALEETMKKYEELKENFKAFKEHSTILLSQERDLNTKLRHMFG